MFNNTAKQDLLILQHKKIESTHKEVFRVLDLYPNNDFAVIADEQINGRGKNGSIWVSNIGNFFSSIKINLSQNYNCPQIFCIISTLAVYDALQQIGVQDISIKWPNDILVNKAKISGIIIDIIDNYLIIGIGINIISCPKNLSYKTISLKELGLKANINNILNNIYTKLQNYIYIFEHKDFDIIRQLWLDRVYDLLGKKIVLFYSNKTVSGIFTGINHKGDINIENNDGTTTSHYNFNNMRLI